MAATNVQNYISLRNGNALGQNMHRELGDYHYISLRNGNALGQNMHRELGDYHYISLRNGNALGHPWPELGRH